LHKPELRLWIEFSLVEFSATFKAGDRPFDPAGSREIFLATGATIEERPDALPHRKRQRMAARFVRDAKVPAGPPPMRSMRWNAARAGPELGK
jgi:hypothetical protein